LTLPKIDPCSSGCEGSLSFRLFLCAGCRRQVVVCRKCDRGQIYCGKDCSLNARRSRQREARRRYQASDRGRQMHADRSRRYRARNGRLTDHGRQLSTAPAKTHETACGGARAARAPVRIASHPATVRFHCFCCGWQGSELVRQSPIRRPRSRSTRDNSVPSRQKRGEYMRI
jgi:hypothetical protein